MENAPTAIIIGILVLIGLARLGAALLDAKRIRAHILDQGGVVRNITWSPYGAGLSTDFDRTYDITFTDQLGNECKAICKTSAFSGVSQIEESVTKNAEPTTCEPVFPTPHGSDNTLIERQEIEAEIAALQSRISELKNKLDGTSQQN